jgi:hypothetical protein
LWFLLFYFFCDSGVRAILICVLLSLCGGLCLWLHPFIANTLVMIRRLRNPLVASTLKEMREHLHALINKF